MPLRDDSNLQAILNNLVSLFNDGTWLEKGAATPTQVLPAGLLPTALGAITIPPFAVSGRNFPGGKVDPLEFGTALTFTTGGACESQGTAGLNYCVPKCRSPYSLVALGPMCSAILPNGAGTALPSYGNGTGYAKDQTYGNGAGRGAGGCGRFRKCNSDEYGDGCLCYPNCREGYSPQGCCICHKFACNSGDFDNGAGMCYPACKPGYTTPTGIVCQGTCDTVNMDNVGGLCYNKCPAGFDHGNPPLGVQCVPIGQPATYDRGMGRLTTSNCDPDEDQSTAFPSNFLNVCYGANAHFGFDSLSGLGSARITHSQLTYDGCDHNSPTLTVTLTSQMTLKLTFNGGFQLCMGIPEVPCSDWPNVDKSNVFDITFDMDLVLTIPFTTDWLTNLKLDLGNSTVALQNFTATSDWITALNGEITDIMNVAKTAVSAVATVAGIFDPHVQQDMNNNFQKLYTEATTALPNGCAELIKLVNQKVLTLVPANILASVFPAGPIPAKLPLCNNKVCTIPFAGNPCKPNPQVFHVNTNNAAGTLAQAQAIAAKFTPLGAVASTLATTAQLQAAAAAGAQWCSQPGWVADQSPTDTSGPIVCGGGIQPDYNGPMGGINVYGLKPQSPPLGTPPGSIIFPWFTPLPPDTRPTLWGQPTVAPPSARK